MENTPINLCQTAQTLLDDRLQSLPTAGADEVPILECTAGGWFADRMVLWVPTALSLRRISLVSSRLPQRRDLCDWWYDILRTTVTRCRPHEEAILAVPGTTAYESVVRASELFGVPRIEVVFNDRQMSSETEVAHWIDECLEAMERESPLSFPVFVSERVGRNRDDTTIPSAPVRDLISFALASRIVLMHVRQNGTISHLVAEHCRQSHGGTVWQTVTDHADQRSLSMEEFEGKDRVVSWLLTGASEDITANDQAFGSRVSSGRRGEQICKDDPLTHPERWLCHWTRPFLSAWPDQADDEFLDELILGCAAKDRSALAALIRIFQQATVFATVARTHEIPTVSWTEVPLREFRQRRIYRRHRRRFDFEPYGIAVRRERLVEIGAAKVVYVEDDGSSPHTNASDESARYQQPRFDRSGKIDWSEEREWRSDNNLSIDSLGPENVVAFVNDATERDRLADLISWPVIVAPGEGVQNR